MARPATIIRKSQSWTDFFQRCEPLGNANKGDVFEHVVKLYLTTHAEYETKLSEVWLLHEVPAKIKRKLNLPSSDEGIDLIAETTEGKYWAIQAKFRSNTSSRLTMKGDIATFTSLAFHTCKNIEFGLICATTSQPMAKTKLTGDDVGFRLHADFAELDDNKGAGWKRLKSALGKPPKPPKKLKPYKHQKRAVANAEKHFIRGKNVRGKMIMPCGTGKSLTGLWMAQALKAKNIVVAVPSLALVKQMLNVWTREYLAHGVKPDWIAVCSDNETGHIDSDDWTANTYDLGVPCTTDVGEIIAFLKRRSSSVKIVFSTYQSGRVLAKAAKKSNKTFDLGIMDEAHKTVGRKNRVFSHLLSDRNIEIKRRVFMTATERLYRGSSDEIVSMDDPEVYGETFELLTFKEAIEAKPPIICDYKFVTIGITEREVRELWEDNKYVRIEGTELDDVTTRSLAAGLALRRAYKKLRIKRAISFHNSIKKAGDFEKQQQALSEVYPDLGKVKTFHVSSKQSIGERNDILKEFSEAKKSLITNARCLTEGVDIPTVDCVLFADPRRSVIDIIQAAGRAMRTAENKKFGYIIVPIVVPDNDDLEEFANSTEFGDIVRVIRPLASSDRRITDYLRDVSEDRKTSTDPPLIIDRPEILATRIEKEKFVRTIELKVWRKVAKTNWRPFEEARSWVHSLDLKREEDWKTASKRGELPLDIPSQPWREYRTTGWVSMGDWLGTGRVANRLKAHLDFEDAREYVHRLGLTTVVEWKEYAASGRLPETIPKAPRGVYLDKGWKGYSDWLGNGRFSSQNKRLFADARDFARSLKLKNESEWREFTKSEKLPSDIPADPGGVYKYEGWAGFGDWLGTGTVAPRLRTYRTFKEARKFARSLGLNRRAQWSEFCKSGKLPSDIPAAPNRTYRNKGWVSMGDWLGIK
jgi:predicted helicase